METIDRFFDPPDKSFFLFGPRGFSLDIALQYCKIWRAQIFSVGGRKLLTSMTKSNFTTKAWFGWTHHGHEGFR